MWTDHYLKFPSEAAWLKAIPEDWMSEGELVPYAADRAVDVVGILYRDDTPEGQPAVPRDGFHVNLRLPDDQTVPASLSLFEIPQPKNPQRKFA